MAPAYTFVIMVLQLIQPIFNTVPKITDFVVVPSSAGGNSSFELNPQSTEERATLDRYHHFHGHSGTCA